MSYNFILLFFFFTGAVSFAQVENSAKYNLPDTKAKFFVDYLNFSSVEQAKTRVDVFVQVPYETIQFVKEGDIFVANYMITVTLFDEDKEKIIVERSWNEEIETKDFDQTISKNNFNLSFRSFDVVPEKYFIRTALEDKDSRKEYLNENLFTVRDLTGSLAVSDIMLIAKQTQSEKSNKILPNVSRNVNMKRDGMPMFFEIYVDKKQSVTIDYIIKDPKDEIFKNSASKEVDSGKTQIFHTINGVDLGLGTYLVEINVNDISEDDEVTVAKSFVSRFMGVPSAIKDLDKAIDQLVYIATGNEIDEIEDAETRDAKIQKYLEFWKKKDPTANSEENEIFDEYYRRVAYANENFSHYVEGWKTDRGMVFILLGAPNNVDRHPFEYDSKPYEVWEYYDLNKNFVFIDETGFGDYRLITPLYGDFYRFR